MAVCSISCLASLSSVSFTVVSGIGTSDALLELIGVVQLFHDQHAVGGGAHQHEVLLAAGGILSQRRAAGLLQRLGQQVIGALAALVGAEEVGLVEVDAVDLVERHELGDINGVGGLLVEGLELLGGEHDVLPLGELVALGDLVLLDDALLSVGTTYCCLSRVPVFLSSMLKEMLAEDSAVENRLTGTETSPKEIVAEPMERAGMMRSGRPLNGDAVKAEHG